MIYFQSYIPIVKKKGDEWSFNLKNINNLENDNSDEDDENNDENFIFEPFILDDISLDYSKIPVVTIGDKGQLKLIDLQTKKLFKKEVKCPYAPFDEAEDKQNTEQEEESSHESKPEPEIESDPDQEQQEQEQEQNQDSGKNTKKKTIKRKSKKTIGAKPPTRKTKKKSGT